MKHVLVATLAAALTQFTCRADDGIDRLDDMLTVSSANGENRARLSGTLELEGYLLPQPAPAFIDTSGDALFNPRFITFLDYQIGSHIYGFAQARVDRGFDPSADPLEVRLDEYAIRFTPTENIPLNVQAGKFATIVGNWVARHGAWDNPFVTAPLPYENLTGMWDQVAARSSAMLLAWAHIRPPLPAGAPSEDKYLRLPIIWGPSYATGFAVSGAVGRSTFAVELKNAAVASRPGSWNDEALHFRHPTMSGRVGFVPNQMWNIGFSASSGTYLRPEAAATVPAGLGLGDYRQVVLAQDVSFAWHHWQVWAEMFECRFEIPRVGDADTWAYYVELKYKFTPQSFGAIRWNEHLYGKIPDGADMTRWGFNTRRLDLAAGYRLTTHLQLKIQYSAWFEELDDHEVTHLLSAQCVVRF